MKHSWFIKGRWYIFGAYVHRDDECVCGVKRRVVIDPDSGYEVVESYSFGDETTTARMECNRAKKKGKKTRWDSAYQKRKRALKQQI